MVSPQEWHGLAGIVGVLVLCFLRVPVAISLMTVALAGNIAYLGFAAAMTQFQLTIWEWGTNAILVALPLFVLMGQLAAHTGLGEDLARGFQTWLGRTRGGLAVTSVMTAASFGAITGSSVAALSAMGRMLLPQMKAQRYDPALAAGAVASGSVLAILIPPSMPLVFYSAWTETSLGGLFMAAIVPGMLLMSLFALYVLVRCRANPSLAPLAEKTDWSKKRQAIGDLVPTALIVATVLICIYFGLATPTESAAIGVAGVLVWALIRRRISRGSLHASFSHSALLTANLFLLLLGARLFSRFLAQTEWISHLIESVAGLTSHPELLMMVLTLVYLVLGALLDTFSMVVLTLPFAFPLALQAGYDPIWFGIYLVVMCEVSLITPPVGMHAFVLQRLQPDLSLRVIYRGCTPYVLVTLLLVGLLVWFPQLALWLPERMRS